MNFLLFMSQLITYTMSIDRCIDYLEGIDQQLFADQNNRVLNVYKSLLQAPNAEHLLMIYCLDPH